jgi:hypothetical protein
MGAERDIKLKLPGANIYDRMSNAELIKELANKIKEIRESYLSIDAWWRQPQLLSEYGRYSSAPLKAICAHLSKHNEFKEIISSVLDFDKQISDINKRKESSNPQEASNNLYTLSVVLEENVKKMKLGEKAEAPKRTESKPSSQPRPKSTTVTTTESKSSTVTPTTQTRKTKVSTRTKTTTKNNDSKATQLYRQHMKELKNALKKYRDAAERDEKGVYNIKRQDTKVVMGFFAPHIEELIGLISEDMNVTKGLTSKDDDEFLSLVKESNSALLHHKYRSLREKMKTDAKELAGSMQEKSKEKTGYRIIIEKLKQFRSEAEDAIAIKRSLDSLSPGLVKDDPSDTAEFKTRVTSRLRELEAAQAVFDQRTVMLADWKKKTEALFSGTPDDDPLKKLFTNNFERLYLADIQGIMPAGITAEELAANNVAHTLSLINTDFELTLNYFKAAKSTTLLRMEHQANISLKREDARLDIDHPQLQQNFDAYFKKLNSQMEASDPETALSKPNIKLTADSLKSFESKHKEKYDNLEKNADTALLCFKQADDFLKEINTTQEAVKSAMKNTSDNMHLNILQFILEKLNASEKELLNTMHPDSFQPNIAKNKLQELSDVHTIDKMGLQKEELRSRIKSKSERLQMYLGEDEDLKNTFTEVHLQLYLNIDTLLTPEVIIGYVHQPGGPASFKQKLDEIELDVDQAIQLFEAAAAVKKAQSEVQTRLQKREKVHTSAISHPDLKAIQASRYEQLHQTLAQMSPATELTQIGPHFHTVEPQQFRHAFIVDFTTFESKLDLEQLCFEQANKLLNELTALKAQLEKTAATHDKEGKYKTAYDIVMGGLEGQTESILALMQEKPMDVMHVQRILLRKESLIKNTKENYHSNLIWVIENAQQELKLLQDALKTESPDDPKISALLKRITDLQNQPIKMLKEAASLKANILKCRENVISAVLDNAMTRMQEFEKYLKANKFSQWENEHHLIEFEKLKSDALKKFIAKSKDPQLVRKQKELAGLLGMLDSLIDRKKLQVTHDAKTTRLNSKESLEELQETRRTYKKPAATIRPSIAKRSLPPIPLMFKHENLKTFKIDLTKLIDATQDLLKALDLLNSDKISKDEVEQRILKMYELLKYIGRNTISSQNHIDMPDQFAILARAPGLLMELTDDLHEKVIRKKDKEMKDNMELSDESQEEKTKYKFEKFHQPELKNLLKSLGEILDAHTMEPEKPKPTSPRPKREQ